MLNCRMAVVAVSGLINNDNSGGFVLQAQYFTRIWQLIYLNCLCMLRNWRIDIIKFNICCFRLLLYIGSNMGFLM